MSNFSKDSLHGKTLKVILQFLVNHYGWNELGQRIKINSFQNDASISSSLVFLRKTPWAREKVENLYLATIGNAGSGEGNATPINLEF